MMVKIEMKKIIMKKKAGEINVGKKTYHLTFNNPVFIYLDCRSG